MGIEREWSLRDMPRERLEALARAAALETWMLRQQVHPNRIFAALLGGLVLGAVIATLGFLFGSSI